MSPKSWTRKFRVDSIPYLLQMAFFYHTISLGLLFGGSLLVTEVIPDYQVPSFPVSITMAATSGPIEEVLFFGIPYYLSGNPHAMLVTGAIWSVAHIFNTQVFQINALGYVNFLITIPHIFFSLRTWASGKGWFAVTFHSAWNLAFLLSYCSMGLLNCAPLGEGQYLEIDLFAIALAGSLLSILYLLYAKNKISKTRLRAMLVISIAVVVISEVMINLRYFELFFFQG